MPQTRSSANGSSPTTTPKATPAKSAAGTKRKVDEGPGPAVSPTGKRGRPAKEQKTIEESINGNDAQVEHRAKENAKPDNVEVDDVKDNISNGKEEAISENVDHEMQDQGSKANPAKEQDTESHQNGSKQQQGENHTVANDGSGAIEEDKNREAAQPSNILEKGIIYFFTRGRVEVENPEGIQDLARTYFVLRPLPAGAKLTDGTLQDLGNSRLIELPKKVFPKSHTDRFMAFVGKGKTTVSELRDSFISGSTYETKTSGTRHQPTAAPIGEGVYAITHTGEGRPTAHLVYMLTIPSQPSTVQKDLGILEKGSFVMSIKNPESKGPASAQLPESANFPKEMIDEFQGRGWGPTEPKHLDYENAQILLIGESFGSDHGLEAAPEDKKSDDRETPLEELEKLEHEDDLRVEHMKDDTIFADLELSSKDYTELMTTWPSS